MIVTQITHQGFGGLACVVRGPSQSISCTTRIPNYPRSSGNSARYVVVCWSPAVRRDIRIVELPDQISSGRQVIKIISAPNDVRAADRTVTVPEQIVQSFTYKQSSNLGH